MKYIKIYRKKPVEVSAMKFETNNDILESNMNIIVSWINRGRGKGQCTAWHNGTNIFIMTLEGEMEASVGDYIICGVKGEFYPCKPDVFLETYEEIK